MGETIESGESSKSRSRSKLKRSSGSNKSANGRKQLTSQSLDRATQKRGQINNKNSLIGKSTVKHPHASDVDLSVVVTEQVTNGNGDDNDNFNCEKMSINDVKDNLRGKIGSNESINDHNENEDDNKETPGNVSEAEFSEDSFVNLNQETTESMTGSLASIASIVSHEIPIIESDDSFTDNNLIDGEKAPLITQELTKNDVYHDNCDDISESNEEKEPQHDDSHRSDHSLQLIGKQMNGERRSSKLSGDCKLGPKCDSKLHSESRCSHHHHHRAAPTTGPIDLSHVTAKVDTRGLDLARRPQSEAKPTKEQIKSENNEMMAKVERSLRKYQLERKIFQELQDLKRCQIRSGRANEPVLVKRLVEKFRKEVKSPGMVDFNDSYSYRSYERFLYDQLRKLSSSNQGKVLPIIKSVSDENLALQFMKTHNDHKSQFSDNYSKNNNNNHHSNYNQLNRIHHASPGLGQKSVSAMSTFGQSKLKKDLHSSFNYNNQRKLHTNEKDSVKKKTKNDGLDFNSSKLISNNDLIINNNNNNTINAKNLSSTVKSEEKVIKRVDNQLWRENKSVNGSTVKKSIKESNLSSTKTDPPAEKIKSNNGKSNGNNPLIVIDSLSDSGALNKSTANNKPKNAKDSIKDQKLDGQGSGKDHSDNQREKINEVKKIINRGSSSKSTIKEIRRTTAKHEQYKSLRGSHKRVCLKSSDANSKPYVEAAVNRPKFKRCKSSIPSRFKVIVPVEQIEKRWKIIKENERRKSAEQQKQKKEPKESQSNERQEGQLDENGDPLEFKLLYEINRLSRNESNDEYDYYNDDDEANQYPVHSRSGGRDDYSDHGLEHDDEEEDSDDEDHRHYNHYLKRTHSEPALIPRDLKV